MNARLTTFARYVAPLAVAMLLSTNASGPVNVTAQTPVPGPKITSVLVSGWTSTTAQISIALSDTDAEVQLEYGTSRAYGAVEPATYQVVGNFTTHTFNLNGLSKATTYHFRIKARASGSDTPSDTTADRTFTTRSNDSAASPVVTIQGIECADTTCTFTYSTAIEANVKLGWDTTSHIPATVETFCTPPTGYPNCANEEANRYIKSSRQIRMTGLTRSTKYYFRFAATSIGGDTFISGGASEESTVTTSASSRDRTFPTGGCTIPDDATVYPIGSCMPDGSYCAEGGTRDTSCTNSCGTSCEAGATCRLGGSCPKDPTLDPKSSSQCNKPECFNNGVFRNPAPAGCYASWPKCSANTVLKVKKDRGCDLWLTCGTSVQSLPTKDRPAENLCLSLSACNQLGVDGQCARYLPPGQCDNDPLRFCANDRDCEAGGTCTIAAPSEPTRSLRDLTFSTPRDISKIANLSGNVIAGLDWVQQGSSRVLQGKLPWQLMRQLGGNIELANADFETNAPDVRPWEAVPVGQTPMGALSVVFEDQDTSINHVMEVSPVTQVETENECVDSTDADNPNIGKSCDPDTETTTKSCQKDSDGVVSYAGGKCLASLVKEVRYSGVGSQEFVTIPNEYYIASARIRAPNGNPILRLQLGYAGYEKFTIDDTTPTFIDVVATSAWQTVTVGPLKGLSGGTRVAVVCPDNETCGTFQVDDLMVKPVLQVNTNPDYLTPSCRLYPREDAPSCDYTDQNGIRYKGWKGFCLESDSVTGSCLSWWPVDIIRGESDIFGSDKVVGYQDRAPMYYCVEAKGNGADSDAFENKTYSVGVAHMRDSRIQCSANSDHWAIGSSYTFALGNYSMFDDAGWNISNATWISPAPSSPDAGLTMVDIAAIDVLHPSGCTGHCLDKAQFRLYSDEQGNLIPKEEYFYTQRIIYSQISSNDNPTLAAVCNSRPRGDGSGPIGTPCTAWQVYPPYQQGQSDHVAFWVLFDSNKVMQSYGMLENDETGSGCEPTSYSVQFRLREFCQRIVQVVTPYGENSAYAQRVNSKVYQVPELKYKRSTDVLPYSGVAGPDPINNPSSWTPLTIQTRTAQYEEGQVRSGSPYSCVGDCSTALCRLANPEGQSVFGVKGDILRPAAQCVAVDSDTDGNDDGYYSGGVAAASNKGKQLFDGAVCENISSTTGLGICAGTDKCLASPVTETCTATLPATGTGATLDAAKTDAEKDCKEGAIGRCSNSIFRSCRSSSDCTIAGYCSLSRSTLCTTDSECQALGRGNCLNESTGSCNAGTSATFAIACDGRCGSPSAGTAVRYTGVATDDASAVCTVKKRAACVASVAYRCEDSGEACSGLSFFGCNGDRNDRCVRASVFTCANDPSKSCPSASPSSSACEYESPVTPSSCGPFSGCTCTVSGQCVVQDNTATAANESEYTNAGSQPKTCASNADCRYNPDVSADNVRFFAQEKLKRLFAQSFGIWEWKNGSYVFQDNSDPNDLTAGDTFFGWRPPAEICEQKAFAPPGECSIAKDTICTASVVVTSAVRATTAEAQANALTKCKNTVACNGSKVECSAQGKLGTKVNYSGFDPASCSQTTGGWTCTGRCTIDPNVTYTNTILTPSTVADTLKIVRPNTAPGDYCAIPPRLGSVSFTTGTASNAVIDGGSGSIGIKFTTEADPEQQPLSTIDVDWGDGSPVESFYYPYAPRTDVRKPHVFSHVYTYNSADNERCNESGVCNFPIKVRVRDAWNWCSNASRVGSQVAPDGSADNNGCDIAPANWPDSGLSVTLNP